MAPPTRPKRPQPNRSNNGPIVIAAIVGIAIVVGVIVAVLIGTSGDDDDTPEGESAADIFHPVEVVGDALPEFTQEMISGEAEDTGVGLEAPVVSGTDYDGNAITIDASADGPTMVVLLAHWCPHCNREIPVLNAWRDSGDVPEELNVVGVSTGIDPDRDNFPPDQWLVDKDWQWPVLADSDLAQDDDPDVVASAFRAYGGQYFPTMIIIGSDGTVLQRLSGEPTVEDLNAVIGDALERDAANSG